MLYSEEKNMSETSETRAENKGNPPRIEMLDAQNAESFQVTSEEPSSQENEGMDSKIRERMQAAERAAQTTGAMKSADLVRIEEMLSHGLADEYATLSPEKKRLFRQEGEALALWLDEVFRTRSARSHEVLARIERWLLIIENKDRASPWLLQEAYVKARGLLMQMMYTEKGN